MWECLHATGEAMMSFGANGLAVTSVAGEAAELPAGTRALGALKLWVQEKLAPKDFTMRGMSGYALHQTGDLGASVLVTAAGGKSYGFLDWLKDFNPISFIGKIGDAVAICRGGE